MKSLSLSVAAIGLAFVVGCEGSAPAPAPAPAPEAAPAPAPAPAPEAAAAVAAPNGEQIYNQYCVVCHGADGKGNNGLGGDYSAVLAGKTDEQLMKSIKEGKVGANGSAMPPWGGTLNDEQIMAVLTHVKGKYGGAAPADGAAPAGGAAPAQ